MSDQVNIIVQESPDFVNVSVGNNQQQVNVSVSENGDNISCNVLDQSEAVSVSIVEQVDTVNISVLNGTPGVPGGGLSGQVLAKSSDSAYDVEWVNQTGGSTGHQNQISFEDANYWYFSWNEGGVLTEWGASRYDKPNVNEETATPAGNPNQINQPATLLEVQSLNYF